MKSQEKQKHLRSLLRQVRKEANVSQQELARRLARPQSFVSKYESGERRLDIVELFDICDALLIEPEDIVKRLRKMIRGE